jgi:hypothetical protein
MRPIDLLASVAVGITSGLFLAVAVVLTFLPELGVVGAIVYLLNLK